MSTSPEVLDTPADPAPLPGRVWVRINGRPVAPHAATVSVFDHGLLYGDGVFEGLRFVNGRPFELEPHLCRLAASAHALRLSLPLTVDELREEVEALIADTGQQQGYIRLLVTRGVGDLGISPAMCARATLILIAAPVTIYNDERRQAGIRAMTLAGRQKAVDGLGPRIKSLNYLPNVLGCLDAEAAGAAEGIFLTPEGYVSEGTGDNIFVVRDGVLVQPDPACGGLEGITANAVQRLAERAGIPTARRWLTRYDLYTADEVFLTGTAVGLVPVTEIDGRCIGSGTCGPITVRLQGLLTAAMERGGID